jgi:hypothetical protein
MPHVTAFICAKLAQYDTAELEWIKLLPLHRQSILHGCCTYPEYGGPGGRVRETGYRLRASVNIKVEPPFLFEHWARIPASNRQGWASGLMMFRFEDLDECAVHTLAHECFHFLAHSRQVKHKNTEANANWWADEWLAEFRATQSCSAVPRQLNLAFGSI